MLKRKVLSVKVNNMPDYEVKQYVVATYDDIGKELWYYGTWDDIEQATKVVNELSNGILLAEFL